MSTVKPWRRANRAYENLTSTCHSFAALFLGAALVEASCWSATSPAAPSSGEQVCIFVDGNRTWLLFRVSENDRLL